MIIIFGGFSGSGKSYTARSISKKYNIPYINSDKVRKELANIGLTQKVFENFGKGLYSAKFTLKTYQELIKKTKQLLKKENINYGKSRHIRRFFMGCVL